MTGIVCAIVGNFSTAVAAQIIRLKKGITAVGNAQVDTAQSKFGGSSALFDDASQNYLSVANTSDLLTGTGALTIEGWFRPQLAGDAGQGVGTRFWYVKGVNTAGGIALGVTTDGIRFRGPSQTDLVYTGTVSSSAWSHIAFVWNGTTKTIYLNGTSVASASASLNITDTSNVLIGATFADARFNYDGWMDEIRISNTARYTTTFTAPTTAFVNDDNTLLLIHADGTDGSTFFEDDNGVRASTGLIATGSAQVSTAQSKFGGASALFNGNSNTQILGRGWNTSSYSGDFTIEGWFYITDKTTQTNARIWSDGDGSSTEDYRLLQFEYSTNQIYMVTGQSGNDSWSYSYVSATLNINTWYHIAASRSGSSLRIFVNGTQQGSTISNSLAVTTASSNHSFRLGMFRTDASRFRGYIDDFRISNSARYTSNFTAPTAPFVNDSNTLLLIHGDGTNASTVFRDDNGTGRSQRGIVAFGNAQVDTAQSKFGGSSVLFDGTGDYLETGGYSDFDLASTNFTVEGWFYMTSAGSYALVSNYEFMTNNGYEIYTWASGSLLLGTSNGGIGIAYVQTTTSAWSANQWNHWAVTRTGSTMSIYCNGNRVFTTTSFIIDNWATPANAKISIGQAHGAASNVYQDQPYYYNGWMDEIRVSNSVRYTGTTYTIPTTPFSNDSNTLLLIHADGTDGSTVFTDDNGVTPITP